MEFTTEDLKAIREALEEVGTDRLAAEEPYEMINSRGLYEDEETVYRKIVPEAKAALRKTILNENPLMFCCANCFEEMSREDEAFVDADADYLCKPCAIEQTTE